MTECLREANQNPDNFSKSGDNRLTNPKGHAVGRVAFNMHYAVILHIHPDTALYEVFILANRIQHDKVTPVPSEYVLSGQPERIIMGCQEAAFVRQYLLVSISSRSNVSADIKRPQKRRF